MSLRIKLEIYSDNNIKAYADFATETCLKSNKGTSQYWRIYLLMYFRDAFFCPGLCTVTMNILDNEKEVFSWDLQIW